MKPLAIISLLLIVLVAGCQVTGKAFPMPTGKVYVTSSPSDASVYVQYIYCGNTPVTCTGPAASGITLTVSKKGYVDYATKFGFSFNKTKTLNVMLAVTSCVDSDGGRKPYIPGKVTIYHAGTQTSVDTLDKCMTQTQLFEQTCGVDSNGNPISVANPISCPRGSLCGTAGAGQPGACITDGMVCTDSDNTVITPGDTSKFTAGTACVGHNCESDNCNSATSVFERYCIQRNSEGFPEIGIYPYGCPAGYVCMTDNGRGYCSTPLSAPKPMLAIMPAASQ